MRIKILTLFPQMFDALNHSIIKRAVESGYAEIETIDIRGYSTDKHKKCDDYPFGGGAGMVMMAQPIYDAVMDIDCNHKMYRIFMSPHGKKLSNTLAKELALHQDLLILCGHYEGVDQRVIDMLFDDMVSIGDYVLTGGELAAMVMVDAVLRQIENVISSQSLCEESFTSGLLEYPQYTRPQNFMGHIVPEVLTSGHHKQIEVWRKEKSIELTKKYRPDLIDKE